MPTPTLVTVKSSGGDYTSLSAAEAGEQGNLVSLDRQTIIECYAITDTSITTVDGWTTDATRFIRIIVPTSERHSGIWSNSKYNLSVSSTSYCLRNLENYTEAIGLQIENTSTGNNINSSSILLVDSCILKDGGSGSDGQSSIYLAGGTATIRNCDIYGCASNGIYSLGGSANIDNCTIVANGPYGIKRVAGTFAVKNTYSGGNSTNAYNGTMTLTTCAHDTATSFTGSTASIAFSTANFENVTSGSEDLHLKSGASATLLTGGTDLSGDFTVDIDGETRSDWSIGADEYVAASGLSIPIAAYHYNHH